MPHVGDQIIGLIEGVRRLLRYIRYRQNVARRG